MISLASYGVERWMMSFSRSARSPINHFRSFFFSQSNSSARKLDKLIIEIYGKSFLGRKFENTFQLLNFFLNQFPLSDFLFFGLVTFFFCRVKLPEYARPELSSKIHDKLAFFCFLRFENLFRKAKPHF